MLTLLALVSLAARSPQDPTGLDAPARPTSSAERDAGWRRVRGPNGAGRISEPLCADRRPVPRLASLLYDGREVVYMLADGGGLSTAIDLGENVLATPALTPERVHSGTTAALYCFGQRP